MEIVKIKIDQSRSLRSSTTSSSTALHKVLIKTLDTWQ